MVTAPLAPRQAFNGADLRYLRGALVALSDALGASEVAAVKAQDPAVRALAGRAAVRQVADVGAVTTLLAGWPMAADAPSETAEAASAKRPASIDNEARTSCGSEVDRRFLELLTAHTHAVLASTRTEMIEGFGGSSRSHAEAASRRCWQDLTELTHLQGQLAVTG